MGFFSSFQPCISSRSISPQIHRVPMSQVMSEGAYMLFYMRTNPRDHNRDAQERHYQSRSEMKPISHSNPGSETASYSDWSLFFISSDKASFTTESTRDFFSTIDYSDGCHSIFNNVHGLPIPTKHGCLQNVLRF